MLPVYDLARIREFIPFNVCMLGQRRSGKSVATWKLAEHLAPNFDLVISFLGTRNCNKELCDLISTRYDPRLNFVEFNPHVLTKLLEQQEKQKHKINSLNLVSCGGSNVAPEMVKRVQKEFNCKFSTLYGQTEYCPVITQHHNNDSIEDICNTIGQPISHTEVSIRSINNNKICPSNTVGEICVRGPSTMLKYFANKEATSETIDKNNWLHTGDLGRMDNRGYVTITGRIKEMIIRGGENHFPAEIENALREHKNISDVAVVGIPDKKWGELIVAFIKFEDSFQANKDEMIKFFRSRMSPQKTPNLWFSVDKFPLTGSGKIQKFILKNKSPIPLKLKTKGIKTMIPPAGEGIPSKKLSFQDGSSSELTLNLASLNATQTTYVKQTNHPNLSKYCKFQKYIISAGATPKLITSPRAVSYTHLTLPTKA